MTSWVKYEATAIANHPYGSSLPLHIKLVSGDTVDILERCGPWALVKCRATSCVGICPMNRLLIIDAKNRTENFDLLTVEAYYLFSYVFTHYFKPGRSFPNENEGEKEHEILDLVRKVQEKMPPSTPDSRIQISQALDSIRQRLNFPILPRSKNCDLVTTHGISPSLFVNKVEVQTTRADSVMGAPKSDTAFPPTLSLHVTLTASFEQDVRICPRIVNVKSPQLEVISAPADYFLSAHDPEDQRADQGRIVLKFHNIDRRLLNDLGIVIKVFTNVKFGVDKPDKGEINLKAPWASEYLGVGAASFHDELSDLKVGSPVNLSLALYSTDGQYADIPKNVLEKQTEKLTKRPASIGVFVNAIDVNGPAVSGLGPQSIITMGYPLNISPSFEAHKLFCYMDTLHLRTRSKRTRIVLRVVSLETKQFLPVFERARSPYEWPTVVQKGQGSMVIDEYAQITLGDGEKVLMDPARCLLVFEVQRTSKSKGVTHLIWYAAIKLTNMNGEVRESNSEREVYEIPLMKPSKSEMTPSDYCDQLADIDEEKEHKEYLCVKFRLVSSHFTSRKDLYQLLNFQKFTGALVGPNSPFKTVLTGDTKITMLFTKQIFLVLGRMLNSNNELEQPALEMFMNFISVIDTDRNELFKHFFQQYVETAFTLDHPWLACLYTYMLNYLVESLPQNPNQLEGEADERCKTCCRCLSYMLSVISASLELSKLVQHNVDEQRFRSLVHETFSRLGLLLKTNNPSLVVSKSFAARSFPVFCDIISVAFTRMESINFALQFMDDLKHDPGMQSQLAATVTNRFRLYKELVETNFFTNEEVRRGILPTLLSDMKSIMTDDNFQRDAVPVIINIFFVMMSHSSSFSTALSYLVEFLPSFLKQIQLVKEKVDALASTDDVATNRKRKALNDIIFFDGQLVLLLLYFADKTIIENLLEKRQDQVELFSFILDVLRSLVTTSLPPYLFFVCPKTFIDIVQMSIDPRFNFVKVHLVRLIEVIAGFYNDFSHVLWSYNHADRSFFTRLYGVDLEPIAALLPTLLKSAPQADRVNVAVLPPLLDFYSRQTEPQSRISLVDTLYMVLEANLEVHGDLTQCENAILAMDAFVKIGTADSMFIDGLIHLFDQTKIKFGEQVEDPRVSTFFQHMKQLTTFLVTVGELRGEDDHVTAVLELIDKCDDSDIVLYPYFTSHLYGMHLSPEFNNKTEAAETLVAGSGRYMWTDQEIMPPLYEFPREKRSARKRDMLLRAVDLFMETSFYERAIEVLTDIRQYALLKAGDYFVMKKIAEKESQCYDGIVNKERAVLNRFYGVKFYGHFPKNVRGRVFIYRRDGFFMAGQMMQELRDRFPDAKVDGSLPSEDELKDPQFLFIHVFNVKPKDDTTPFDPLDSPAAVSYRTVCGVDEFYSEFPVRIRRTDGQFHEMAEWHRQIVSYKTSHKLQGMARRVTVVSQTEPKLMSPIECAVYDTEQKTLELMRSASVIWRARRFSLPVTQPMISSLSLLIQGIVNANVNGGTAVFRELFLEGPLKNEPGNLAHAEELRCVFRNQFKAIKFAIKIHEAVMSESERALHENWVDGADAAEKAFEPVIGKINYDEPPTFGDIPSTLFLDPQAVEAEDAKTRPRKRSL